MKNRKTIKIKKQSKGFTLIEALVSLLLLSFGLLGIGNLIVICLKSDDSSYMRSQATVLAYNILDDMRANRTGATSQSYDVAIGTTPTISTDCSTAPCTTNSAIANYDLAQWKSSLSTGLPDGDGSVTTASSGSVTTVVIVVQWNDSRAESALDSASGTISFSLESVL